MFAPNQLRDLEAAFLRGLGRQPTGHEADRIAEIVNAVSYDRGAYIACWLALLAAADLTLDAAGELVVSVRADALAALVEQVFDVGARHREQQLES